jgi:hypothetical protein
MTNVSSIENLQCVICCERTDDVINLCPNGHCYCPDCLNNYIQTNLMDGKDIKSECLKCKAQLYEDKYERMLMEGTKTMLFKKNVLSYANIPLNLFLLHCPTCTKDKEATILIDKNDHSQYYKCDICKKSSCLYCRKEVHDKVFHESCSKFLNICKDLEKVIEYTISHSCSKCKPRVISNYINPNIKSGCSHIICPKCNMQSCYVCGGHFKDIDKGSKPNSIFGHHEDWKINPKRCPMYVKEFKELVSEFPADEIGATFFFSKFKIQAFVKKVIDKYGQEKVKEAFEIFKDTRLVNLKDENYVDFDYKNFKSYDIIDQKIFAQFKI